MNRRFSIPSIEGKIDVWLILRLILALSFALIAFIFSEVIPNLPPLSSMVIRVLITFWFGLLGYGLFPDLAQKTTALTISWANSLTHKVSAEVMSQLMRLPQGNPLHIPYSHHAPLGGVSANQPIIIDTSALIDGRILDIVKTGFINGLLLIPSFVLVELQQVADSSDFLKRSRARRGFEVVEQIKKIKGLRIEIWDKEPMGKSVDDKILRLAKNLNGKILTTDFNLNKVASISGIHVLNINDLANAVKTLAIPGEELAIKVIHLGKDVKQGVGYLADGTMVVVENGADLVGKEVKTEVTRMLQVPAGRMIFSKINLSKK